MIEKVSLYIPAFNAEQTIQQAINSAENQKAKFDEIIVVNDFSTDKTEEKIASFNNVKLINNKKNEGLGKSRNIAIRACKNNIVASIDADVILDSFWLENMLYILKKDKVVLCGGNLIEKFTSNQCNKWRMLRYKQNWGVKDFFSPPFIYGCNTIQYKKIWEKVKGYDENLKTNGEDINYCEKIAHFQDMKTFYSSKSICYHLQNDNIVSLSKRVWRYHSYGYKIKNPSLFRFFKLSTKQIKFLLKRIVKDFISFKFYFILIDLLVFFYFILFEFKRFIKKY